MSHFVVDNVTIGQLDMVGNTDLRRQADGEKLFSQDEKQDGHQKSTKSTKICQISNEDQRFAISAKIRWLKKVAA